jgi:hypothetical protein
MRIPLLLCAALALPRRAAEKPFPAAKKNDRIIITGAGKPVAEFVFNDPQILRPYLANVRTREGIPITRPLPPPPDSADHATMHPGIWLAFGDVCGHDFWRNKGIIKHERFIQEPVTSEDALTFSTLSKMMPPQGPALAEMRTTITFTIHSAPWLLIWDASITPLVDGFYFGDQEEMGLGFRMAPALTEKQGGIITSSAGKKSAKETWGQTAAWCDYSGPSGDGLMLIPSAENFRPSWFHNRDYGLMVANPFGKQAFTRSEKPDRTPVEKGRTFRLRFGVASHGDGEFTLGALHGGGEIARRFEAHCRRDEVVANLRGKINALTKPENAAGIPAPAPWSVGTNTHADCVSNRIIVSLYGDACRKLKQLYGNDVKSWFWKDLEGYSRVATVVERRDTDGTVKDHLIIKVNENNDNDAFSLSLVKGAFQILASMKLQPSWELPKEHFPGWME